MVKIEIFVTPTCPSCQPVFDRTFEIVEEIKREFGSEIEIEKIDVTRKENLSKAWKFKVTKVPTIVVNGNVIITETLEKERLLEILEGMKKHASS